MSKFRSALWTVVLTIFSTMVISCGQARGETAPTPADEQTSTQGSPAADTTSSEIPLGAQALIDSYPDFIKGYADNKILFTDGTEMIYDDGKKKSFEVMLDDSDLEDMFYVPYRKPAGSPGYQEDAGRSRCDRLFKKMYGNSAGAVQRTLVSVPWFGGSVKVTGVNGVDKQLRKVYEELLQHPELHKYLKSSGTFYWRPVRGAKRMSAHSYGIAFDIGVSYSDYWLWKNKGVDENSKIKYANRIPHEIVDIFEKHGFIWGGSWYHYDTMHFEYRPEILRYAALRSDTD